MDIKWIHILVILVFYQKITGDETPTEEGTLVEIKCQPSEVGSMVIWFRVLDTNRMEFIASFSNNGIRKQRTYTPTSVFIYTKILQHTLILKSFNKARDSGVYSCASLFRGMELKFGNVTRLVGGGGGAEEERGGQVITTIAATATEQHPYSTATACACSNSAKTEVTSPSMFCNQFILGPLAGGCGLLLLLLIITITYCNKIRTRRCPHHYKRKPQMMAAEKL